MVVFSVEIPALVLTRRGRKSGTATNYHDDKGAVELIWNGKTSEVCNIVLPFQVIKQMDEPRAEKPEDTPVTGNVK
jgi:hypothetical protein